MNIPFLIALIALIVFLFTFIVPMGNTAQKGSALVCAIALIIGAIMHYT